MFIFQKTEHFSTLLDFPGLKILITAKRLQRLDSGRFKGGGQNYFLSPIRNPGEALLRCMDSWAKVKTVWDYSGPYQGDK